MGTSAPDSVKRLVDHFHQNRKVFLSFGPPIRRSNFDIRISPHGSLGWDVYNKAGLTEVQLRTTLPWAKQLYSLT